jgi:predicted dehydrogenase
MKQVLESLQDGTIHVADVPVPRPGPREILIQTSATLISAGTERMLVEFGRAGWLERIRQQPDKVRLVLDKMRADGFLVALQAVRSKLDEPLPLGYCQAGVVLTVGSEIGSFSAGDRVISNGPHAEFVAVPKHFCCRIPAGVPDEEAVFTVPAAIGLEGIRLASPSLGECVAVIGLGLIGLLTVQLLLANGCRVIGFDPDPERRALARSFGARVEDPDPGDEAEQAARIFSRERGVDAVIVTASTPKSDPIHLAAKISRKRGRIVLVGVTGLELSRADFYEKELSFQVSCSYGPGRHDPDYEQGGHDYPVGHVRWTVQRNFEAILDLMATGDLRAAPLITHRFSLEEAKTAYDRLMEQGATLGILLDYPRPVTGSREEKLNRTLAIRPDPGKGPAAACRLAVLGAGNYARRVLVPAFRAEGAVLQCVVSAKGVSAAHLARRSGFARISTDPNGAVQASDIDAVIIVTRHNLHASQVLMALRAGKHVFCEKPLCLTLQELEEIQQEIRERAGQILMVGFNRRFAPGISRIREQVSGWSGPRHFILTVNAGSLEADHWTRDPLEGGGRIVGEACHFVDLIRFLVGSPLEDARADATGPGQILLKLGFSDGSSGTVHYLTVGHRGFPKERLEVFGNGRVLVLENFRKLRGWGSRGFWRTRFWRQDKGQRGCVKAFLEAVETGGGTPIPLDEIFEVSRASIELQQSVGPGP